MTEQVTTMLPVTSLPQLGLEWRVLAFRPNNSGVWNWNINSLEVQVYQKMVSDGLIVAAHRRDADGTRLLAKVKKRK